MACAIFFVVAIELGGAIIFALELDAAIIFALELGAIIFALELDAAIRSTGRLVGSNTVEIETGCSMISSAGLVGAMSVVLEPVSAMNGVEAWV
jgi:hypothetical protein